MTDDPLALLARRRARPPGAPATWCATSGPGRIAVAATKSSPTDVVTAMDRATEELLRSARASARPDDGVLGEEEGRVPGPAA